MHNNSQNSMRNTEPRRQSLELIEEIMEEILLRLPVKSLLRLRCVSKSWLALIDSDQFIKIHLQNSTKNTSLAHQRVIFNVKHCVMNGCSLQSLMKSKRYMIDPTNNLAVTGNLVGCCNGLLCFVSFTFPDAAVFWLWNPATRVRVELPKTGRAYFKWGFGQSESSGAYKVFAVVEDCRVHHAGGRWEGKVYSSETNSWKTVPYGSRFLFGGGVGQFVRGRIHWARERRADHEHEIECFDLESDEFGRIELPPPFLNYTEDDWPPEPYIWLGEIRGCLCASFDYKHLMDVWVMKEYGVKDSWIKLFTFFHNVYDPSAPHREIYRKNYGAHNPIFGESGPNGAIFMIYGGTFMLYTPKDKDDDDDDDDDGYFDDAFPTYRVVRFSEARIYVEGLVSPQRILNGTNTV